VTTYLLDANVFIQAKNLHYGMEFCPAFWDWLKQAHTAGTVFSIDKVKDELLAVEDELSEWTQGLGSDFFRPTDAAVLPSLGQVSSWATNQNYEQTAVNTFLQVADFYLVAHGLATGHTIVTHEVISNSLRKIKIPNAYISLGISFVTPFEMLRRERARFVLQPNA